MSKGKLLNLISVVIYYNVKIIIELINVILSKLVMILIEWCKEGELFLRIACNKKENHYRFTTVAKTKD